MKKNLILLLFIPIAFTNCSSHKEDLKKSNIDTLIQKTDSAIEQSKKVNKKMDSVTIAIVEQTQKRFDDIKKENELIKKQNNTKSLTKIKQTIIHDTIFIEK